MRPRRLATVAATAAIALICAGWLSLRLIPAEAEPSHPGATPGRRVFVVDGPETLDAVPSVVEEFYRAANEEGRSPAAPARDYALWRGLPSTESAVGRDEVVCVPALTDAGDAFVAVIKATFNVRVECRSRDVAEAIARDLGFRTVKVAWSATGTRGASQRLLPRLPAAEGPGGHERQGPVTVLLVLGNRPLDAHTPSLDNVLRAKHAASIFHLRSANSAAGALPWVLPTGGRAVPGRGLSEAEQLLAVLLALGVPRERILLETAARTTADNIKLSMRLLAARGHKKDHLDVVVVTKTSHAEWALPIAQRLLPGIRRISVDAFPLGNEQALDDMVAHLEWRQRGHFPAVALKLLAGRMPTADEAPEPPSWNDDLASRVATLRAGRLGVD